MLNEFESHSKKATLYKINVSNTYRKSKIKKKVSDEKNKFSHKFLSHKI